MDETHDWINKIKEANLNIDEANPHYHNKDLQSYLSYYKFEIQKMDEYRCGKIEGIEKNQFIQFFLKRNPKGTIYLVHGYLDHSGGLSRTINQLLSNGYQVIVLDLPGHGFSEGEEGVVASFDDYLIAVEKGYNVILDKLTPSNVIGLGHSTGGALLFHASAEKKVNLAGLILIAPLYYPFQWNIFKGLLLLSGKVIAQKKRAFKRNSNDNAYQRFLKSDPLQLKVLKSDWLVALEKWQQEIVNCPAAEAPVYLLQGTRDTTVSWKENISFYQEKSNQFQVALFPGARHQLLNERREISYLVHQRIDAFLKELT